ncbi:single-stranded DNA-binding protein [Mitsuokella jalaludinii]|mgnify:FL=1|jgi:single-stranded DNA-binding protein|uniref:single-stranded DNA-binding protein n=1 Tax=Mitsuokella jalaludinii TaxID=187979 RepID=UPI001D02C67A|nr:single-stranded DNA-binding protein [Mitsuokella jalaludinii]MCB5725295.1 single-stranded DNA-binding protein [Mitsuokella jalaludinii]
MNHVTLTGTVFQPESRVAKSGMAVLTFHLSYYQGKGKDGKAAYGSIDVTAFDRLARAWDGQLHDKDKVIVTGHITLDKWEKDGKKYYKHRLIADDIGQELNLFANSNPGGQYIPDEEVPF